MPATYDPIATTTLGSANATIAFNSIPNTFTDLRLVFVGETTTGSEVPFVRYNGDTANNYSFTTLFGSSSILSQRWTNQSGIWFANNSSLPGLSIFTFDLFNYAGSTFKTTLHTVSANAGAVGYISRSCGLWRSTSAITSLTLNVGGTDTFRAGATATLYGILRA